MTANIQTSACGATLTVRLTGPLDQRIASSFFNRFLAARSRFDELIVDLTGIDAVYDAGLAALRLLRTRARQAGKRLAVVRCNGEGCRVFARAGWRRADPDAVRAQDLGARSMPMPPQEAAMQAPRALPTVHDFTTNHVATDPLPRDQTQSRRLHEPSQRFATTDPVTGRDIEDTLRHPHIVDGDLTIYFESEASRRAYLDMATDHPFHLTDNPIDEGCDEG